MAEPLVKICGLHSVEVLKSMKRMPIDYIGFVFAPSRRQVTPAAAAELLAVLAEWESGRAPQAAGVFVDPPLEELRDVLAVAGLDVIQLHGAESAAFCREVKAAFPGRQVWKAISVSGREVSASPAGAKALLGEYAEAVDGFLLDTFDPNGNGGSGRTFDWAAIPAYQAAAAELGVPLFVAGGLTPDNVNELLLGYAPDGVDVSSGVESSGVKDIAKIKAFVERVKQS